MTALPTAPGQPLAATLADPRWTAVLNRDASFDGAFVYAVRSTGIYCRASCPARRPHPARVRFFRGPAAAERHGYRPCKRCRPHQPASSAVERACRYLDAHRNRRVPLAELARVAGLGPSHLHRTFTRALGVTPRQYAEAQRLEQFKTDVATGGDLSGSIYHAGYGSSSRLYEQAPAALGMTPATYRKRGQGMTIRYTTVATPLGRLLVGATERGICAVSLGNADAELEGALRAEYPAAAISRDEAGLREQVTAVLAHVGGARPAPALPLDIQATAFQRRVWQALRAIPRGATLSYREVAERVGAPDAARAVARACAGNPVAIVIPCHRVVRADGGLGGYRWGIERKHALLDQERTDAGGSAAD